MIKSNTSVTFLINFIEVLKPKLTEYQRLLKLVKKYLHVSNLNKKYVQKVLSTDEKEMIKFLDAFLLELTRNYSKILKANSIMKSFNTSQVEESDLYTSISLKTYNEQVDAYNKLITEFDLLRNYLKKGKLINSNGQLLLLEVFNGEFRELVGSKRDEGYNLWKALSSKTDELKLIGNDATLLQIEKASRDPDSEIAMKRLERRVVNLSAFDSVEPKSIRRSKNRRSRRTFIYICKPDDIPPIQRVEIEEDLLPLSLQHESAQDLARLPLKKVQKSDLDNSLLPKMERKPIYRDSKSFNSEHEYQSIDELVKKQSTQDLTGLPSKKIKKYGLDNSVLQQMEENPRGSWTSEHQYEVPKEPIDKKSAYDLARLRLKKIKKPGLQTSNLEHEYQSFDELDEKQSTQDLTGLPSKKIKKSGLQTSNLEHEYQYIDELVEKQSTQDLTGLPSKKIKKSDLQTSNLEHEYQSIDELVKKQSTQDLTGLPSKKIKKYDLDNSVLQQMEENPRGSWTSEHQYEVPKEPIDKKSAYDLARLRLKKIKKPGLQTSNLEHEYQSFDELVEKQSTQDLTGLPSKKIKKSGLQTSNLEHEYQSIDELVEKQSTQDLTGLPSKKIKKYGLDNSVLQQMEENPRGSWTSEHQYEVPKEPIDKKSAYDLARLRLKKIKKPGLQTSNLEHEYQSFDELKTKESEFPQSDSGYVSPDKMKSNSTFKDSLSKFAQYLSKLPLQECCLLPNANKNPTYFMETKRFMLKNSCGFDSIAQILLANVTDYPNFKNASQQNSQVIDLILKLRAGPCSKAASLRDDYLVSKNIALAKSDGKAPSLVIDLFGTILGVWVKYFDELPSAYRHFTCHPENRSKKSAFEIVKFDPTKKISIKEELNGFESDKLWCNLCGKMSETYFELQNYLFIDLTISAGNKKYKCKLNMFPEKLNFLKTKFRLAGVIEGDSEHFKSYVRRINGDWELYDDLKERVTKCFAFYVIAPEALVYIRE